eukprot:COSAG06_NODE_25299_length_640_cov_1.099815_2_plen_43_part_01
MADDWKKCVLIVVGARASTGASTPEAPGSEAASCADGGVLVVD